MLAIGHTGDFASPVTLKPGPRKEPVVLPFVEHPLYEREELGKSQGYDFAVGVADLARALSGGKEPHLPFDHGLHVLELTLGIVKARSGDTIRPTTTFAPLAPLA
jgi:hypothetical protein